jgi:hypothetical protein
MRHWLDIFKQWIWSDRRGRMAPLPPRVLRKVAQQIEMTHEVEYSCDDVLHLLDQFAEAVLRGENVAELMPLVQRHLDMCPDCREEFEALMRILRASRASAT